MFPVPVLKLKLGRVRVVPAIVWISVLAPRVGIASVNALASVMATVAPVEFRVTTPLKSLELVRVITPAPALIVSAPVPVVIVVATACVNPTEVTVRAPATAVSIETVPKTSAFTSLIATSNAPVLVKLTVPVKLLVAVVRVITPAPALTVAAPAKIVPVVWLMPTPVNTSD